MITPNTLLALSITLSIPLIIALKRFFQSLDQESRFRLADLTLEDPFSPTTVPAPSLFDPNPTKTLSIIIPAYNEEDRLPSTLNETLAYLQRRRDRQGPHFTYECIIVDDGSMDNTASEAFKYVRKHGFDAVRVLRLPKNKGKGYAVKAGMLCARGESLLMMDADGATRVSDLEKLEEEMKNSKNKAQFILGSRAHLQDAATAQRTASRNVLMHGFHFLVTLVVGPTIRDTQCGFKLFTRNVARVLFINQRLQRWAFDVELVYLAKLLGISMAEVQVHWTEIPGSKVRITSILHIAFELVMIAVGYGLGWWRAQGPNEVNSELKKDT